MKYRVVFLFCFTAANIVLGAGACLAYDVSGADLFQSSSKLPAFTSPDQNTEMDPCAKAIQEKAEVEKFNLELAGQEKLLYKELKSQKEVYASVLPEMEAKVKSGANILTLPRSTKYTSYFELDPERDEFVKQLDADLALYGKLTANFNSTSGLGKIACLKGVDARICSNAENDRQQTMSNLSEIFAARTKLLTDLKQCVKTYKPFFQCRASNASCSLANLLNGTSQEDNAVQFKKIFREVLKQNSKSIPGFNADGDICRQAKEYYEAELGEYKSGKKAKTDRFAVPSGNGKVSAIDVKFQKLDGQLEGVDKPVRDRKANIEGLKTERDKLFADYIRNMKVCAGKDLAPEIVIAHKDWEITRDPNMPDLNAITNVNDGAWTFKINWSYKNLICSYPAKDKVSSGQAFNALDYIGGGFFGGEYGLTLKTIAKAKETTTSVMGSIKGLNPERNDVMVEIKRQLENSGDISDLEVLEKIVCQESRYTQFKLDGYPYACNTRDIGLFQVLDVAPMSDHCRSAWDWKFNVTKGIQIYGWKKDKAIEHHKYEMNDKFGANNLLYGCIKDNLTLFFVGKGPIKGLVQAEIVAGEIADRIRKGKYQTVEQELVQLNDSLTIPEYQALKGKIAFFSTLPPPLGERKWNEDELVPRIRLRNEAIRRYNKGREYTFVPTNYYTCEGIWKPKPKLTDNPKYVEESLSWNPNTCR